MPLSDLDFAEGAPAKRLTVAGGGVNLGNAAPSFEAATPFAFPPADAK